MLFRVPQQFYEVIKIGRGYRKVHDEILISQVVSWLESIEHKGYIGEPFNFHKNFERYNGK